MIIWLLLSLLAAKTVISQGLSRFCGVDLASSNGGAENAGHEITGHAQAKQKTSSEATDV